MVKVSFHGGPADGESFTLTREPDSRVILESVEVSKQSDEIIWFIYLYRKIVITPEAIQYWLGDIQVAANGREKWGKGYKEMLH